MFAAKKGHSQKVCAAPKGIVFVPFRSDKGIDFAHIGLESGMVFEETTKVDERIYRFNSKFSRGTSVIAV